MNFFMWSDVFMSCVQCFYFLRNSFLFYGFVLILSKMFIYILSKRSNFVEKCFLYRKWFWHFWCSTGRSIFGSKDTQKRSVLRCRVCPGLLDWEQWIWQYILATQHSWRYLSVIIINTILVIGLLNEDYS